MGVVGGAGTEIRNAAVKGSCSFNLLNIHIAKSCFPRLLFHVCYCTAAECFLKTGQRLVLLAVSEDETTHGFPLQTAVLPWPWPQDTLVRRAHDQHPSALAALAAAPLTSHLPTMGWIYTRHFENKARAEAAAFRGYRQHIGKRQYWVAGSEREVKTP